MKEHEDKVYKEIKKRLDAKMIQDKLLVNAGTFKDQNDHGIKTNLDHNTYLPIYNKFITDAFKDVYNAKTHYKGTFNYPDIHKQKMKRKICMKLWHYLFSKQDDHLNVPQ